MIKFQHLANLFSLSPSNRGVVRLDFDEAAALYDLASSLPEDACVVEIGRFKGGSSILIASALKKGSRFTSIDIRPAPEDLGQKISDLGLLHDVSISLLVGNSKEALWDMRDPANHIDLLFIDGDHSYEGARADHMTWGRRVKAGGYIVHHDMAKARPNATQIPDLKRLREDILSKQSSCAELVDEVGSISIFKRRGSCWKSWKTETEKRG